MTPRREKITFANSKFNQVVSNLWLLKKIGYSFFPRTYLFLKYFCFKKSLWRKLKWRSVLRVSVEYRHSAIIFYLLTIHYSFLTEI